MTWSIEEILDILPDGNLSLLFYRIFDNFMKEYNPEYISPSAFKYSKKDGKMSTNWNKYSDANQTRLGGEQPPERYGIISLIVKEIRLNTELSKLKIEHRPKVGNRAHTDISGLPEYEAISKDDYRHVQLLLSRLAEWEINNYLI